MGCYVCGARSDATCHHCYQNMCEEHAVFVESISDYLYEGCALAFRNGQADILAE